jgi:MATE family multidrug resistance protein
MLKRWNSPHGYKAVFKISLPLVASMASTTVMLFTDRMFLGWYSVDAIAAATPAGLTAFMFMCFFLGVVTYTNTFIAQYTGSGTCHRVGSALWQAIYFALAAGLLLAATSFIADPLFEFVNHPPEVRKLEAVYFRILMLGAVFSVMHDGLSCFYSGRGLTVTIMVVSFIGAAVNIPLDYGLINGAWGLPGLGIAGAAYATVTAHFLIMVVYILLIFTPQNNREFSVWRKRQFKFDLFRRLMKFGLPAGISFFIDIFAFTFFLFIVGQIGKTELAATNIAFAINTLGFLPMIGFGIGTSTLVGQAIGRGQPEDAVTATYSALHICFMYMAFIALVYVLVPEWLFDLFRPGDFPDTDYAAIRQTGKALLVFVALYSLFDTGNIIFAAAIKGAGDTRFVTWTVAIMSSTLLVIPVYVSVKYFKAGLYTSWTFTTAYVILISLVFWWRFLQGKWKSMRVIEAHPAPVVEQPGIPTAEV